MVSEPFVALQAPPLPYYLGAGISHYRAGEQHPNRKNLGLFDLLWVVEGELYIGENGKEWTLAEGQTLLLLPDGEHYAVKPCERDTVFYWVHFETSGKWEMQQAPAGNPRQPFEQPFSNPYEIRLPHHAEPGHAEGAMERLKELVRLREANRSVAFWKEQKLLFELLRLLEESVHNSRITPAVRLADETEAFLKQNYPSELTNGKLAEALHFHPNYIVRCMKERFGRTPMEYLHEYRLEQAKLLLVTTEWSVAQIAERVGFRHTPYFSSCFKRRVGVPPLRYRRQFRT